MKCTIPEISWHNREPVLSVDIHPLNEKFYRLASGGADCHVLIWHLTITENGAVKVEPLSDLTRHQKAVNVVRWSPTGQYLATADDDANIIIWQLKTDNIPLLEGETNDKEVYIVNKILRGHKEDVYDLCWSPDGLKLLTGSIDNTAILWDFTKGKNEYIITDHKGFVQGVAWDPKSRYIATISTDRVCRIIDTSGKVVKARIQKGCVPAPDNHYLKGKEVRYFHDDTFKSFFRRLSFSPDGSLLVVPSGRIEIEGVEKIINATYIFAANVWNEPVAVLPNAKQCVAIVRFCPIQFELHEDGPDAIVKLPYRMIFAIGTDQDVILYDTQQTTPFAHFHQIHYTRLTDLTWSNDGRLLIASSTDGFCALITFDIDELGVKYVEKICEEVDESLMNESGCDLLNESMEVAKKEKPKEIPLPPTKPRKLNLLEQWTIKSPKQIKPDTKTDIGSENKNENINETEKVDGEKKKEEDDKKKVIKPKRITPILISR